MTEEGKAEPTEEQKLEAGIRALKGGAASKTAIDEVVGPAESEQWNEEEIRQAIEKGHPAFWHEDIAKLAAKLRADADARGLGPGDVDFRFDGTTMIVTGKASK